jgi:hypothetical protein
MFVCLSHDEILQVGEQIVLVFFWKDAERVVQMKVLDNVRMERERVLIGCMRYWLVRAEKTELGMTVGKGDARESPR